MKQIKLYIEMMKQLLITCACLLLTVSSFAQTTINVDVSNVSSTVDSKAVGLCLSYPTDDDSYFPNRVQTHAAAINSMKAGSLRFPMGTMADNYLWTTPGTYQTAGSSPLIPRVVSKTVSPANIKISGTNTLAFCNSDGTMKSTCLDFDEFMALAQSTNTEPIIMVNAFGYKLANADYTYQQLKTNAVEWGKICQS